jgi:hypothetical protein
MGTRAPDLDEEFWKVKKSYEPGIGSAICDCGNFRTDVHINQFWLSVDARHLNGSRPGLIPVKTLLKLLRATGYKITPPKKKKA